MKNLFQSTQDLVFVVVAAVVASGLVAFAIVIIQSPYGIL